MAYTKVTRAHNGKKAINYLFGASHSEGIERNYHITGVNMVSFDSVSPSDQFARYWNRASDRVKVQVIRVTQSFSDKEFDPNNEADILTAHEVGVEAGKQIFGDRQFIVATQIDGKSGYIHNHIFANNINMITNLGMRGDDYQHSRIQQISDDVIKSFGVKLDYGKNKGDKYTQAERAKREKSEYVWKDDLKERIRESIDASSDFDSFEDALAFRGVSVQNSSDRLFHIETLRSGRMMHLHYSQEMETLTSIFLRIMNTMCRNGLIRFRFLRRLFRLLTMQDSYRARMKSECSS